MPLNPQAQQVLENIRDLGLRPAHTVTPQEARENARQRQRRLNAARQIVEVGNVENRIIDGPGGPLPIRIYTPAESGPYPILAWFHGGGWVVGDLESAGRHCPPSLRRFPQRGHIGGLPPGPRSQVPRPAGRLLRRYPLGGGTRGRTAGVQRGNQCRRRQLRRQPGCRRSHQSRPDRRCGPSASSCWSIPPWTATLTPIPTRKKAGVTTWSGIR